MFNNYQYILDDDNVPIPCHDSTVWGEFFANTNRRTVERTQIDSDIVVSTVFLGLDHSFVPNSPPVLFETLVFGGEHDGAMRRYYTWELAEQGHWQLIKELFPGIEKKIPNVWESYFTHKE